MEEVLVGRPAKELGGGLGGLEGRGAGPDNLLGGARRNETVGAVALPALTKVARPSRRHEGGISYAVEGQRGGPDAPSVMGAPSP
jgi:hypothetical protein